MLPWLLLAIIALLSSPAAAQRPPASTPPASQTPAPTDPGAFTCQFRIGASRTYAKGSFRVASARALAFGIDAIDLDGQKAQLVTTAGKGPLRIVRALGANHFLEVITEGYLNITTIYAWDPRRQAYPAVHSRHIGLLGEPLVAQYVGFCSAAKPGEAAPPEPKAAKPTPRKKRTPRTK